MAPATTDRPPIIGVVADRLRTPRQRRFALYAVKGSHTLIFFALGTGVLETVRAGVSGRTSRATGPAIAATIGEGIILVTNGNRCPLTNLAEALGATDGRVSDIFLPNWFARHIPSICTTLFGFGLGRLIEAQTREGARADVLFPSRGVRAGAREPPRR
ncbi:MAG TPA: hypothetical protein VH482_17450 [Thermomicrobiales bacterium]|jgi:hypothetical protein